LKDLPELQCPNCGATESWLLKDGRRRCTRCRRDWRPGRLPLRLSLRQWREVLRWFVRDATSAEIARETGLERKRVVRALMIVRQAVYRSEHAAALRVVPRASGIADWPARAQRACVAESSRRRRPNHGWRLRGGRPATLVPATRPTWPWCIAGRLYRLAGGARSLCRSGRLKRSEYLAATAGREASGASASIFTRRHLWRYSHRKRRLAQIKGFFRCSAAIRCREWDFPWLAGRSSPTVLSRAFPM
jgi:hypothetical protein